MDGILFDHDTSILRALILAVGKFETGRIGQAERAQLVEKLADLCRDDPDAGIHSAALWALRQLSVEENHRMDGAGPKPYDSRFERRWYTNGEGQTFALIDGPVELQMGSAPTDLERDTISENPRHMVIPRPFAVSTREVTAGQFKRFVNATGLFKMEVAALRRYSAGMDGPCLNVSWYAAAAYCNWLSEKEGIPKEQWCYEPNTDGAFGPGMTIQRDALNRSGYRMPTEAEWEYSCRAGTRTSRYYGHSIELLPSYALWQANSAERASPTGSQLPNDLGLFDTLGNVYEWCLNRTLAYKSARMGTFRDVAIAETIGDQDQRIFRGSAFTASAKQARSASRGAESPYYEGFFMGFRVARTCPPAPRRGQP
jgi:hypothetical protein